MAQAKQAVGWLQRMMLRGRSLILSLILGALGLAFAGCPPAVMYGPAPEYGAVPMYGVPVAKAAVIQQSAPMTDIVQQDTAQPE